jgi:hypothetical protein
MLTLLHYQTAELSSIIYKFTQLFFLVLKQKYVNLKLP